MKVKPKWLVTYEAYNPYDLSWPVYVAKGNDEREAISNAIRKAEGRWEWKDGNRFRVVRLDQTKQFRVAASLMEVFK